MTYERRQTIFARLPIRWQTELRRLRFARQLRRGTFETSIAEFDQLASLVSAGDWVVDVGANVGHYSKRLSDLVGPKGRVLSLEPVPETFAILAANVTQFKFQNTTLLNIAASDTPSVVGITVPLHPSGLRNFYRASIDTGPDVIQTLSCRIDSIQFTHPVSLIKVDAEGHDSKVLLGARQLIERDRPSLIVEGHEVADLDFLAGLGYLYAQLEGSPNCLLSCPRRS